MPGTPRTLVRSGVALLDAVSAPLFRATGGNVGLGPTRLVELTTTGRRSGKPRTIFLTSYLRVADGYLVVGTHGGSKRQPDWYYNISADPHVTVTADGHTRSMRARITEGPERKRILTQLTLRGYGIPVLLAQLALARTRTIPLVVLEAPR